MLTAGGNGKLGLVHLVTGGWVGVFVWVWVGGVGPFLGVGEEAGVCVCVWGGGGARGGEERERAGSAGPKGQQYFYGAAAVLAGSVVPGGLCVVLAAGGNGKLGVVHLVPGGWAKSAE